MSVEQLLFEVTDGLRIPVLALALACLAIVVAEIGALLAELARRRGRGVRRAERIIEATRTALTSGQHGAALRAVMAGAYNRAMADALAAAVEHHGRPDAADRIAKRLAEYDYRSVRRLERTRILVRIGPALGLMGTLIPLSPALAGLARGDVARLTEDLRVAFGVTVVGLLVGALAFAVSLIRDRLYAQDYSDVEYVVARLTSEAGR
jgi:biopolymer transport protein ExbB/TolQ